MSEAVEAMLDHGFGAMGLRRIEAIAAPANTASAALLQRRGFQREAVLRDYYYRDGAFFDHHLFACLPSDRPPPPPAR